MPKPQIVRKTIWEDRALDEQARDLREAQDLAPDVEVIEAEGLYSPGMSLAVQGPPRAVECIRAFLPSNPDAVVAVGSVVSFSAGSDAGQESIRINAITGLAAAVAYHLVFRVTY